MKKTRIILLFASVFVFAACGQEAVQESVEEAAGEAEIAPAAGKVVANPVMVEIEPGLTMKILIEGNGAVAQAGQDVTVHYTGWLYDEAAENSRGEKFDSSVDRDKHFKFTLGAGGVIKGWDKGVVGMQIGETRELTIAPELAYGDRAIGSVIAAGSTLVFAVELAGLSGGAEENPE